MDFYDKFGTAAVYAKISYLITWEGKPVALISRNALFSMRGTHIGFISSGWIRDRHGDAIACAPTRRGVGPMTPIRAVPPAKAIAATPPTPEFLPDAPEMPKPRSSWSAISIADFFEDRPARGGRLNSILPWPAGGPRPA
ncbi:4-fold beta flower protein [Ancylobacter defluvii]|uniref:4-fold beta flower protein n=1 Tax=Ancylobacter defluvii TaxID=1282440 RepID=UPI0035A25D60